MYTRTAEVFENETPEHISLCELRNTINNSPIVNTLIYITKSFDNFTFQFNSQLTESEVIIFDNILTNFQTTKYYNVMSVLEDVKASNTAGGSFYSGSWVTRTLNTSQGINNFISLENNQFTLSNGVYMISATAPAYGVSHHKIRLYDITHSVVVADGTNAFSDVLIPVCSHSTLDYTAEVGFTTTYELQHQCTSTRLINGFGDATNIGDNEIFTTIKIQRLVDC